MAKSGELFDAHLRKEYLRRFLSNRGSRCYRHNRWHGCRYLSASPSKRKDLSRSGAHYRNAANRENGGISNSGRCPHGGSGYSVGYPRCSPPGFQPIPAEHSSWIQCDGNGGHGSPAGLCDYRHAFEHHSRNNLRFFNGATRISVEQGGVGPGSDQCRLRQFTNSPTHTPRR